VFIPLTMRAPDGTARAVSDLPGTYYRPRGDAVVTIKNLRFDHQKVVIARGRGVRWIFKDTFAHDVTTANGPSAFGSPHLRNGQGWHRTFTRPGTYRVYCTLHPVDMHQIIKVR